MCKSIAMGGQRCPGHASQRLAAAQKKKAQVETAFAAGEATERQLGAARKRNWVALVEYASTLPGADALRERLAQVPEGQDREAQVYRAAINDGASLAQANRRKENEWRAERGKGPLQTPVPLTLEQEAAAQVQAQAEQVAQAEREADPFGLRSPQQEQAAAETPQPPTVQTAPAPPVAQPRSGLPTNRPPLPVAPPIAARVSPTLPTQPPATATAAPAPTAREQRVQAAAEQRAERARVAAEQRAERARVAAEQRALRAQATARNREVRRLQKETAQEARAVAKWARQTAANQYTAPQGTWNGPAQWGAHRSWRDNMDCLNAGYTRYPGAYHRAMKQVGHLYTPADIYDACERLDGQIRERLSGQVRPAGWYQGYEHLDDQTVQAARMRTFAQTIGPREADVLAAQYIQSNLAGVLAEAAKHRPRRSVRGWAIRRAASMSHAARSARQRRRFLSPAFG